MLKRIALILVLLLTYVFADAQSNEPSYKKELWKLPVPTTPNAAALGKFGDIQVGLATGIPSIDVPIFNYSDGSKNLNVPIQLRYHAGGYKVEDMASNVGLGWALDAGGMISRAMNGTPDERPGGYLLTDSLPDIETHVPELFNYFWGDNNEPGTGQAITWGNARKTNIVLDSIENRDRDGQADLFNISAPGLSAKFVFTKDRKAHLITQQNLTISFTGNIDDYLGGNIDTFRVVDNGTGINYVFAVKENQTVASFAGGPPRGVEGKSYISNWHLKYVISADKKDTISFEYDRLSGALEYEGMFSESRSFKLTDFWGSSGAAYSGTISSAILVVHEPIRLKQILFPDSTVVRFDYKLARKDYTRDSALTSIIIKNREQQKKFNLTYDYFDARCVDNDCISIVPTDLPNDFSKKLKLLRVNQVDANENMLPPYEFTYDSNLLPGRRSNAQDHWGYYNGKDANTLIPEFYIFKQNLPGGHVGGALRDADPNFAKAGILEMIKYPTGGSTRLFYEGNNVFSPNYFYDQTTQNVNFVKQESGLHKSLPLPDRAPGDTVPITIRSDSPFKLDTDETENQVPTGGNIEVTIRSTDLTYLKTIVCPTESLMGGVFEKLVLPLGKNYEVFFNADYLTNINPDYELKLIYTYTIKPVPRAVGGLRVAKTEDYDGVNGEPLVTSYNYAAIDGPTSGVVQEIPNYSYYYTTHIFWVTEGGGFPYPIIYNNINFVSTPAQALSYFQGSPVIYNRVKVSKGKSSTPLGYTIHTFTSFERAPNAIYDYPYVQQQPLEWKQGLPLTDSVYNVNGNLIKTITNEYSFHGEGLSNNNSRNLLTLTVQTDSEDTRQNIVFGARSYYWMYGRSELNKKTTREYLPGGTFEQVIDYSYYPDNYQLSKQRTYSSSGETYESRFYYVNNFNQGVLPANTATYNGHKLVSQEDWMQKNGNWFLRNASVSNFEVYNNIVRPSKISMAPLTPTPESTAGVFNPAVLYRIPGMTEEVNFDKYDTQGNVTEVKFRNKPVNSLIWDQNSPQQPVATIENARLEEVFYTSFEDATGTADANAVTGDKVLLGSFSIPFTIPANSTRSYMLTYWTSVGNSWELHREPYTAPKTIVATKIDEVRVLPVDAMMTTYTAKPLVGITSTNDPKNLVSKYEYDPFLRLMQIRDIQQNILKKFEYSYNAPTAPGQIYRSAAISQAFTKNDCAVGYAGTTVTYAVAAGKYSSTISATDATNKAWAELNANGQQYANTNGQCIATGCTVNNCAGPGKRCVGNNCETGIKICTSSVYNSSTTMYDCTFHYEWSDNVWSADFIESSPYECLIN
ncbi:DUF5977 domain-containing protein [Chitinophaga sp. sic0106]|uniref:DUF5977 domain-containing protein n=1 Tax=Chitinophaga sp. sic0106 TaxID=2854785 RepID=UPI001C436A01|nr:DUF5977 domain-containing protein [Chitinophaga sp. sic0106]MBV7532831.1 hypothetical protein [Chitinophaga sp. sic0106]